MKLQKDKLIRILLTFAIVGYPLLASISVALRLESTPISIGARGLALLLSLVLVAISIKHGSFSGNRFFAGCLAIFWLTYIGRITYETIIESSSLSRPILDYWIWAIGICLIPMLAISTSLTNPQAQLPKAFIATYILAGISAAIILGFGSGEFTNNSGESQDIGRLNITSLNPISTGHLGTTLILLSIWGQLAQNSYTFKTTTHTILRAIALAMGLYLLIASASRGPFVALIATMLVFLVSSKSQGALKLLLSFLTILIVGFLFVQQQRWRVNLIF
jgi:hypothetical protein